MKRYFEKKSVFLSKTQTYWRTLYTQIKKDSNGILIVSQYFSLNVKKPKKSSNKKGLVSKQYSCLESQFIFTIMPQRYAQVLGFVDTTGIKHDVEGKIVRRDLRRNGVLVTHYY